jgi:hypothetical protein
MRTELNLDEYVIHHEDVRRSGRVGDRTEPGDGT